MSNSLKQINKQTKNKLIKKINKHVLGSTLVQNYSYMYLFFLIYPFIYLFLICTAYVLYAIELQMFNSF